MRTIKARVLDLLLTKSPELHVLREMLMHKYGREYSLEVMENKDSCVSDRVCQLDLQFIGL